MAATPQRSDGCAEASRSLLAKAREELAGEDVRQASEKLWSAVAQMVKAVAQRRGWPHDSHRLLFEAVNRLAEETGDPDLRRLFRSAASLHTNFYEDWHPRAFVEDSVTDVEQLLGKLQHL